MKIFVTGGAGYVGSHSAKALRLAGYRVVIFDNLSAGHREATLAALVCSACLIEWRLAPGT